MRNLDPAGTLNETGQLTMSLLRHTEDSPELTHSERVRESSDGGHLFRSDRGPATL